MAVEFLRTFAGLIGVSALLGGFTSIYVLAGIGPSPVTELFLTYALPVCFATWVQSDAHRRRCTPCFDFGTFVFFLWPVAVPSYLLWTRGWYGLPLTVMFVALLLVPWITAAGMWMLYSR